MIHKTNQMGSCNNAKFVQLWRQLLGKELPYTRGEFKINEGQATLNEVTNKGHQYILFKHS